MTTSCRRRLHATLITLALGQAGCTTLSPQAQTATLITRAEAAMGSASLNTLTVTGRGTGASVGQAHAPGQAWPGLRLGALSRSLNFETASFREEFIRSRSRSEGLGGGTLHPPGGSEARGVVLASDAFAWDVAGIATVAVPSAVAERAHDLWTTTPPGAIKAAARMGARAGVRRDFLRRWDTLSFELPGRFSATLVLEDTGLISRIESTVAHALLGEMPVVTEFLEYRLQAGLMLPSRIVQSQGGFAALDLQLTAAIANEPVEITVPDNVRTAVPTVDVQNVADGVWFLGGGTHNSVAIETATQIVLIEVPLNDTRARAVLSAASRLVPGKQPLTVINTHHHFDHAGGLRFAKASGATILTSALAKPYYEAIFTRHPIAAAGLLTSVGRASVFVAVEEKAVLGDAERLIEIHEVKGSLHARGLLMVWLPREQLLVTADAFTPGEPRAPDAPLSAAPVPPVAPAVSAVSAVSAAPVVPAVPDPNAANLVQNLERLGLAPKLILPLHGRVVTASELYTQAGRSLPR